MNNLLKTSKIALFAALALPALIRGQVTFINIGEEQGLSSLQIIDLFQDSHGFVWIGTPHGLNRFDGYGCVQYLSLPNDTASLSSSYISPHSFTEDTSGNLWVATYRGGLNYFNRKTERFTRYQAQTGRPNSISMDKIFAIEPDGKGGLWIATAGRGINHFDPGTQWFRAWNADNKNPNLLMGSTMTGYLIDTNTAIYYLDELLPDKGMDFLEKAMNESGSFLYVISKIELLGWQAPNATAAKQVENFVDDSTVLPLDDRIVNKTIEIRRVLKIKLPDAVIASTALVYDFTLISRNDTDFRLVSGLKYLNPFTDL